MNKIEYEKLGVMIDMSRNAVMNMDALKRYMDDLQMMGYNCVFLYTEDTYEVDGEPLFGYMRSRYSKAELKDLDAYAAERGIELIPCVQTLAHFDAFLHWESVKSDVRGGNIILVDDDRTYEFIENLVKSLRECFRTEYIHIGMDEAHMLGRGKHLDLHGYESATVLMKRHLAKVNEIVKQYDFKPMIWSDMFFRAICDDKYYVPKIQFPREVVESIPENVIPVYWDYYQEDPQVYDDMMYNHEQLSDKTWFAGGAWSWYGLVPFNRFTIESMLPALDACKKHKIKNVFMTMWGDDGAECSHFSQLPSLFYLAEYAKGNTDEAKIKAKFKRLTGIDYDKFMLLDSPNEILGYSGRPLNPSKYMLYSDYFLDFLDYSVKPGAGEKYKELATELHAIAKTSRKYGYLFDTEAKLCDALAIKYELGLKTRRAYEAGDKAELERLAKNEYVQVEKLLRIFGKAFEKQWFKENKTHGFDIQDHRIGSIVYRTDACRRRLLDYVNGKIDKIEEFEEAILPLPYAKNPEESMCVNNANLYSSTNLFAMMSLPL